MTNSGDVAHNHLVRARMSTQTMEMPLPPDRIVDTYSRLCGDLLTMNEANHIPIEEVYLTVKDIYRLGLDTITTVIHDDDKPTTLTGLLIDKFCYIDAEFRDYFLNKAKAQSSVVNGCVIAAHQVLTMVFNSHMEDADMPNTCPLLFALPEQEIIAERTAVNSCLNEFDTMQAAYLLKKALAKHTDRLSKVGEKPKKQESLELLTTFKALTDSALAKVFFDDNYWQELRQAFTNQQDHNALSNLSIIITKYNNFADQWRILTSNLRESMVNLVGNQQMNAERLPHLQREIDRIQVALESLPLQNSAS